MDRDEEAKYHRKLMIKAERIVGSASRLWGTIHEQVFERRTYMLTILCRTATANRNRNRHIVLIISCNAMNTHVTDRIRDYVIYLCLSAPRRFGTFDADKGWVTSSGLTRTSN